MESNSQLKKIERKLRKHQHVLSKETAVICSESPTLNLGICNVGSINGLSEETIIENFHKFGILDRILLIPGKSCAFLSYKDQISAEKAFKACNGTLNIAQDNKPIFMSYVRAFPQSHDNKIYDRLPPGLSVIEDFITPEEELLLLSLCKFEDSDGGMKHRQVKHFGYEFRYDNNNVDKDKPLPEKIPSQCEGMWGRLPFDFRPDQLTVNHYKPGQGIPPHIDTHSAFEDPILSLSLNSSVVMEFKRKDTICVLLPPRSLLVMSRESRYAWNHGIIPRKFDYCEIRNGCSSFKRGIRVSFTFRKIRSGDCDCDYNMYCDSYKKLIGGCLAEKLESQHVHDVYEDIAGHFSETRHKPWPNILTFVQNLKLGGVLIDVGCGNGKYLGHNSQIIEIGTDRSIKLNDICKNKGLEVFIGNCLNLPLKDQSADAVISIAVIHHLSTEERRIRALTEIVRVLRLGGEALVYVWAKQQIKNQEKSTYIKQDRKNRKNKIVATATEEVRVVQGVALPVHTNRTDFNHSDLLVPWKLKNLGKEDATFLRFYHVFEEGELEGLCGKMAGVEVVKCYYDQGNYCVQFRKI